MTQRLYYFDSYLRQFTARVQHWSESPQGGADLVLDQTAFYPTSGGQPFDLGRIEGGEVMEVYENEEGAIVHRVDRPPSATQVRCEIDWPRRLDHMQQHTGQHILSQAFVRECQLNTVGFHMGKETSTIDLEAPNVTAQQLRQAEDLANAIVFENRSVKTRIVPAQDVPTLNLRKESLREGPLRIVEVEDFDLSACGGTHVRQTGEIGAIVIRRTERINRQARVEFLCGRRAVAAHRADHDYLDAIAQKFSVGWYESLTRVEKQLEETKQLRKTLQEKNRILARLLGRELYEAAPAHEGWRLVTRCFEGEDADFLKLLVQSALSFGPAVILLGNRAEQAQLVFAQTESIGFDLRQILSESCQLLGGKGGGTKTLVQGGGKEVGQLAAALDLAASKILSRRI
ncbi:MAG: alanyl-tRNA editing protein [Acidobacteriota bacterium]